MVSSSAEIAAGLRRWEAALKENGRKEDIVRAFIELSEEKGAKHVTVTAIVNRLGVSRKTFYYHFQSIDELHIWMFRRELGAVLEYNYPKSQLVYEEDPESSTAELPYYARVFLSERLMSQALFFECLGRVLGARAAIYSDLLESNRKGGFLDYLHRLYERAIHEDAAIVLEGHAVSEYALNFISKWLTGAFLGRMVTMLRYSEPYGSMDDINPFCNIQHEILYMYHLCEFDPSSSRVVFGESSWGRYRA